MCFGCSGIKPQSTTHLGLSGGGALGNGGEEQTYQFNVPAGRAALNAALRLADPNYDITALLVDPHGEPVDVQSSAQFDASDNFIGFGPDLQFFRRSPAAGRWTLTLLIPGPIDGTHLTEPFTGAISFKAPPVSSSGVPHAASTIVSAGHPVTATIRVTNTGTVRKDFFADARLSHRTPEQLLGSDVNDVPLPLPLSAQPNWLVPTGTNNLTVAAQGTVPVTMDIQALNGDPDRLGMSSGNTSVATLTDPEVAPGFFFGLPDPTGPFPPSGVAPGSTVNLAAVANTFPFDPGASASSGDVWAQSVDATAPYTPISLAPGQSGTIAVTFTPTAASGSVVRGFIAVDTFNLASLSGDEITTIPYTYRAR